MKYKDLNWEWFPITTCRVCGSKARRATPVSEGCGGDSMIAVCGPNCAKVVEDEPSKYPGLVSQHG